MLSMFKVLITSLFLFCISNIALGNSEGIGEKKNSPDYTYNIAVCAIFKDEAPYLKEWIEYNKLIGVQYFRLYNNESTDNYLEVLDPYIRNGEVSVVDWPGGFGNWCFGVQGPAMLDAVTHLRGVSKWLAIIDIDEFILPTESADLTTFLKDYEPFAAVVINWLNYGTSWVQDLPTDQLMIEVLTLRAEEQTEWNSQVKSIVRPECIDTSSQAWTPHLWKYLPGKQAVAPNKQSFFWGRIDVSKIRINHYVHRSEYYLYNCKIAKKARMEKNLQSDYVENWHRSCNMVEDKSIFRFVPALREKIFPSPTPL